MADSDATAAATAAAAAAAKSAVRIRQVSRAKDFNALVALKYDMLVTECGYLPSDSPIRPVLDVSLRAAHRGVEAYFASIEQAPNGGYYVAERPKASTNTTAATATTSTSTDSQETETPEPQMEVVGSVLWFERKGNECFVAEAQERLALIRGVVVAESARGQGVGKQLMAHAEACIRAAGIRHSYLDVTFDNGPAKALYHSAGYSPYMIAMIKTLD